MPRTALAFLVLVVTIHAAAAPKQRSVRVSPPADQSTVTGWLAVHAKPLASTELQPYSYDLAPLGSLIGEADVVGLGEGTHGTHEFHTVKLRIIDYLVRERGFDVVAWESPFPICNRLNTYILGGPGEPRAILAELWDLGYFFWDDEEIEDLVEWMREYNATRGERPPVQLAGMDVFDEVAASDAVVAYLRTVDPPAAAQTEVDYACVRARERNAACFAAADRVHDTLAAREAVLVPQSSAGAFHDALHNTTVVVQSRSQAGVERDRSLAENALWIRDHRGATRKMIVWAHSEHVSRSDSEWAGPRPMGAGLATALGDEYFAIATLTGGGSFHQWAFQGGQTARTVITTFPPPRAQSYESSFSQSALPAYFVPLRGTVPSWLSTASRYNAGTTNENGGGNDVFGSLPEKFDAAIYVSVSTPTRLLR
jgi:erythromycin esterase